MPEGPEVLCQSLQLHDYFFPSSLRGNEKEESLYSITINEKSRYYKNLFKEECFLSGKSENSLSGEVESVITTYNTLKNIFYFRKKIVFHFSYESDKTNLYESLPNFEYQNNSIDLFIISFLGMSGKWLLSPSTHSGIIFKFKSGKEIYFDDVRHFGSLKFIEGKENFSLFFEKYGKDYLSESENISLEEFTFKISKSKKSIAEFLIDQSQFSGLGNYLRSDILFLSKIHPLRDSSSLSPEEILSLFSSIKIVLEESTRCGGYSLRDYSSIENKKGSYSPLIYGKKVKGDTTIKKIKIKGRSVYTLL